MDPFRLQNAITNFIKIDILFGSYKLSKKWGPLHFSNVTQGYVVALSHKI